MPSTHTLLVTLEELDLLRIIDLETGLTLANIPVGREPSAIALDATTQQAIVANEKDDSVSIIDLSTRMLIATLSVGNKPKGLAIHPDTLLAVVANEKDDSITLIDLNTQNVITTLPISEKPGSVAIYPEENQAIITHEKEDLISILDLTSQSIVDVISVGKSPSGLAVNATTQQVLVTNEKDDSLSLIDLNNGIVLGQISVGENPMDVAIHPATHLVLVVNSKDDTLSLIDLNTAILTIPAPVGKNPTGVGTQTDSNIAVIANKKNDTVSILNLPDGSLLSTLSVGKDPEGVAVDSLLNLSLITNKKDNSVSIIDLATQAVIATLSVGKDPHGVAINATTQQALVANKKDDSLSVIDLNTLSVLSTILVGRDPLGVAIDPLNNTAYITQEKDDTISIIDLETGTLSGTLAVGKKPQRIALDSETQTAVVTNKKDNTLSVIDLAIPSVIATLAVGRDPMGVAIRTQSAEAFVVNRKDNTVSVIDLGTQTLKETLSVGKRPREIALHPGLNIAVVSNEKDDTVSILQLSGLPPPSITGFTPSQGPVGAVVIITGENFETIDPSNNQVSFFNNIAATVSAATATTLTMTVPADAVTGPITLTTLSGTAISGQNFIVENSIPILTTLSPSEAIGGSGAHTVTLTGSNFIPGSTVSFGGNVVATTFVNRTQLTAVIPASLLADQGNFPIAVNNPAPGGGRSNTLNFTVIGPVITDFSPSTGKVGTPVSITGQHFDLLPSNNAVFFNGKQVIITSATPTQITTTVPQGATTGPISVTTPVGTATAGSFTVVLSEDFSILASPTSIDVMPGGQTAIQVLLSGTGAAHYSGLVGLSVSPLPTEVTSYFAPSIGQTGQSSFLSIFTPDTLNPGTYPVTLLGEAEIDGQTVTRSTSFTLNVLPPGTTSLSGQILSSDTGNPLANVLVKNSGTSVTTDAAGNFFFSNIETGSQLLLVDGSPAGTTEVSYPIDLPVQVEVVANTNNTLTYPVYLHEVNTKHVTSLDTSQGDVTVSDPDIPGFELTIPQGVQIIGWDGQPNTQMSIKRVPIDRLPLPPIPGDETALTVYMFHFFKAGGGTPTQPIPVKYPNDAGLSPGTVVNLHYYDEEPFADPTSHQWKIFGTGTVSSDARQIISDPGVGIPKFCCGGASYTFEVQEESNKATPDNGPKGGDPVDLATGIFELEKTDIALPGIFPVQFTRYYTARRELLDSTLPRPFGLGTSHSYDHRLIPFGGSADALILIMGDDGRAPFSINPDGTFTNDTTPSLQGSVITIGAGGSRILRYRDGRKWVFTSTGFLQRVEDPNGNGLDLIRAGGLNRVSQIIQPGDRTISFQYDGASRITSLTDPLGRVVQYTYDTEGRLDSVIDPEGGVTRYTYDALNRMTTITDARGILFLSNEYDVNDRVTRQTGPDGSVYQFLYYGPNGRALIDVPVIYLVPSVGEVCPGITVILDPGVAPPAGTPCVIREFIPGPADRLVTQTITIDPNGSPTSYRFNAAGYPIEITDAAGQITQFEREAGSNQLLSITDSLNRLTTFTYDAFGNQITTTDPDGNTTTLTYDTTFNQLTSITDPLGQTTSFVYDAQGNLLTATDPSGAITTTTYTPEGQPETISDPLGNISRLSYDLDGNVLSTIDPLGNTTTRSYDAASRLLSVSDPRSITTGFTYDDLNRVTEILDPGNSITRFTYDANGNLSTVTDANGNKTTYTYDVQDRLEKRTDPLLRSESYSYDLIGNLVSFVDRKGQITTFSYDALSRRVVSQYPDGNQTAFFYDTAGRLDVVTEAESSIDFDYDNLDRLVSELTPQGVVSYAYDVLGRRTSMSMNGGLPVYYQYDNRSNLTQVTQGTQIVDIDYDLSGRRERLSYPNGTSTMYSYDRASQLTNITHQSGTTPFESVTYTYDPAGNRTSISRTNGASALPTDPIQAAYDAANQQIQFNSATPNLNYDANGNLISQTDASGTTNYIWDARNRLVGISGPSTTASFVYDALGRRTRKTINETQTDYQYDGHDIVTEIGGGAVGARYLRSLNIDEPFVRQSSTNEYYHVDVLGSTFGLTDNTGAVTTTYEYEAFGKTTINGTSSNPFQYTGRENDGTELYYYRARYYTPILERFVSEDPLGFESGFNFYAYVDNDPFNFVDPLGKTKGGKQNISVNLPDGTTLTKKSEPKKILKAIKEAKKIGLSKKALKKLALPLIEWVD